jgi:hypothetical protein
MNMPEKTYEELENFFRIYAQQMNLVDLCPPGTYEHIRIKASSFENTEVMGVTEQNTLMNEAADDGGSASLMDLM